MLPILLEGLIPPGEAFTMARLKFFLLTIALGLLTACGGSTSGGGGNFTSDPPPTNSVSGTVTFKGAPLAGATVTAFLTNSNVIHSVTTTDANGNYSFNGLPASGNVPADFQFWVSKTGYGFYPWEAMRRLRASITPDSSSAMVSPTSRFTSPSSTALRSRTPR